MQQNDLIIQKCSGMALSAASTAFTISIGQIPYLLPSVLGISYVSSFHQALIEHDLSLIQRIKFISILTIGYATIWYAMSDIQEASPCSLFTVSIATTLGISIYKQNDADIPKMIRNWKVITENFLGAALVASIYYSYKLI